MTFGDDPEFEDGAALKERIRQRERDPIVKETIERVQGRERRLC